MKRAKWQKKLSAKDMQHLKHIGHNGKPITLKEFKRNRKWQTENNITCYECRSIALTIGIEGNANA